jgi:hypothetical protein
MQILVQDVDCEYKCNDQSTVFNDICRDELKSPICLHDLCHSNIAWFIDRSTQNEYIDNWELNSKNGIYILWHKNDYCEKHERFLMRALYVGKGNIGKRFRSHWKDKDFSNEMIIYFSYVELVNRLSKYLEQLLLDIYAFPYNKSENYGKNILYAHFNQGEVD